MSMKIYNGVIFDQPIQNLLPVLQEIREQINPFAKKKIMDASYSLMIDLAITKIYNHSLKDLLPKNMGENEISSIMPKDWGSYQTFGYLAAARWAKYNESLDSNIGCYQLANVSLELSLFPYKDKTLAIPFGPCDLECLLADNEHMKDYAYWNNSDKPENVSTKEWEERKQAWSSVLETGIPAKDGFSYTVMSSFMVNQDIPEKEGLMEYFLKTRERTVQRVSRNILVKAISTDPEIKPITAIERVTKMQKNNTTEWQEIYKKVDMDIPKTFEELLAAATKE